jgi:hypothetical protein
MDIWYLYGFRHRLEQLKKIEPKNCGEIFEPKKLVKFETKVGEMQLGQ